MGKRSQLCVVISALLLLLGTLSFAQESAVRGNLNGVVVDASGAVVQGATVTLTGPIGSRTTKTDVDGKFIFALLSPGAYAIKVEQSGFKAADIKGIEVATGRTSSLRMQLEPGAVNEVVEVSASAVTVDTTSTATGSNLNDAFYSSVPVPRNVSGLFYVAPGVSDSGGAGRANPSISGGSGLENLYVADGVNITDPAFGGLGVFTRQYGSVGTGINLSFIKEVQVKTGGFEPQYGQSTGGVVQIVTKSGSSAFHGGIAGYAAPAETAATPNQIDQFRNRQVGQDLFTANGPTTGLYAGPGHYDASAELGGYVPGFKNSLFFFGSYNPSLNTDYSIPPQFAGSPQFFTSQGFTGTPPTVGLFNQLGGRPIYTRAWTNNYAGKLTWKISNSHSLESSVFGDPTSTNNSVFRVVNAQNSSVFSSQNYSTRNWVVRYNGTWSPTWLFNANFTWNNNQFTETPSAPGVFNVVDRTVTGLSPTLQGLGFVENHNADNFGFGFDTSKSFHFLGQHTFMIGFNQANLNYDDIKSRTGGTFAVPDLGATLNQDVYGCATATGNVTCPLGFSTNAQFSLIKRGSSCTLCPLFTTLTGQTVPVALSVSRGEFGPPTVSTEGRSYSAYGNDVWTMNKHLSFSLGLRWEQYRMTGETEHYTFTDNWAPRLGVVYDPWGDRKTKVYLNWARYNYQMPLDAAIRSLSNELDLTSLRFAPVVNADGTITVIPDAAHLLNLKPGGTGGPAVLSAQAGNNGTVTVGNIEGFAPGTKMQYEDEYVAGFERDLGHGFVMTARYVDRRLRRVVEDMGGVSPEGANLGLTQTFLIANPSSSLDLFTNEPVPQIQPQGAACPPANTSALDVNGNPYANGLQACYPGPPSSLLGVNGEPAGAAVPDGILDGFANPVRNYQAAEFELNKAFSKNWLMRLNYRLAYLRGNYEGAFRNDNGQTDPSISSLFDFTTGVLGLLGDQFAIGPLNTDRHHVGNAFFSYTFSNTMFRGLTLGTGMRIQSGTPISEFADHPVYGNSGEVPLGGRGKLGRTPSAGSIDLHAEYAHKLSERFTSSFGADLFNVTNSKPVTLVDQNRDLTGEPAGSNLLNTIATPGNPASPGAGDFLSPIAFQNPFYARFSVKLTF